MLPKFVEMDEIILRGDVAVLRTTQIGGADARQHVEVATTAAII